MHAFVRPSAGCPELFLDLFGKVHALSHVFVLHQFENDVTFRRLRVESLITFLVVVLHQDYGIFPFGHFQIFIGAGHTQRVGFSSPAYRLARQRVRMYGHEQVGIRPVGDFCPSSQRNEHIGLSGINHFYVWTIFFHQFAECLGYRQVDVFLAGETAYGTGVFSAVSCIDDQGETVCSGRCGRGI